MTTTPPFSVMGVLRPWLKHALLVLILGAVIGSWLLPRQPSVTSQTIADIKAATVQMGRYANTVEANTRAIDALTHSLTKEFNKREEESDNLTATLLQRYGYDIALNPPGVPDPAGVLTPAEHEGSGRLPASAGGKGQDGILPASYLVIPRPAYPAPNPLIDRAGPTPAKSAE